MTEQLRLGRLPVQIRAKAQIGHDEQGRRRRPAPGVCWPGLSMPRTLRYVSLSRPNPCVRVSVLLPPMGQKPLNAADADHVGSLSADLCF